MRQISSMGLSCFIPLNCHQLAGHANHGKRVALSRAYLGQPPRDHGVVDVSAVPSQQKIHLMHARKRNMRRIPGYARWDQAGAEALVLRRNTAGSSWVPIPPSARNPPTRPTVAI